MQLVVDGQDTLGECVLWCECTQRVLWTDIQRSVLYAHTPESGQTQSWPMPERLCCFALTDDERRLLLGLASGLALFDFASGEMTRICDVEAEQPGTRLNDGRCDRQGRFVFGMFNEASNPKAPLGGFYRLNADLTLERLPLAAAAIANSICFSPDGRTMYFTDSQDGAIRCCDYDPLSGALGPVRVFAAADAAPGEPDGAAIDAQGGLWSARWGAGQVVRFSPDGVRDQVLALPAPQPSCPAFGGAGLDILYVTSAREHMSAAQLAAAPQSGGLFRQQVGVRGLPESRFRLATLKIGLVGLGKIAVDQHIPAIRNNPRLELVAGCSPRSEVEGLDVYRSVEEMLHAHPEIEAVAICTPPQVRQAIAEAAIAAGRHVFLEKPPAATLGEGEALRSLAAERGVSVLAGWHSRFAPGVEAARGWMAARRIESIRIDWRENVRQWHPGQRWIFEPGGMGVFDPGINALSILTRLLGGGVVVQGAELCVPANCNEPIQAHLRMRGGQDVPVEAHFDFLQEGVQTWSIQVAAAGGESMALHMGGKVMEVDGKVVLDQPEREYPRMYEHFARLIAARQSDLDMSPLRAVADARLVGKHITVDPFVE